MVRKNKDLNFLNAAEAVRGIKSGKFTALELMRSCARRIEEADPQIKAWKYFDKEKAFEQAQMIDEKIRDGREVGNLCGIPVGIKDIFNTADMPTGMGSPVWEGFTPGNDARAVTHIRWADAVIAGKTVTAEFAVHSPGETVNPHDFTRTPGTSSSGSAAAVAACMVPLAIGTQTAGSTIRPASYCGVYGFKPSFGVIPRTGVLKTLDTLDHVTFFSRSVRDLFLMFESLRVKGENFPFVHKFMDKAGIKSASSHSWRVAFIKGPAWGNAENYAKEAVSKYILKISGNKNINIKKVELPQDFNSAHNIHEFIYSKALSYYFREEYENHRNKVSASFCRMVEKGKKIGIGQYRIYLEKQNKLIHSLERFFNKFDIIITLSTAGEAPLLGEADKKDSCLIWTLCHAPALNLPLFRGPNKLPFGAQIVADRYRDHDLIRFAQFLENLER